MDEISIYALVVIYNRRCEDSPSCEALKGMPDARAVVIDNSTEENDNARYCAGRGFGYLGLGGNRGLAVAYNRGIAWIKAHTNATHVVLFDDDTVIPEGFLEETEKSIKANPKAKIFLPRVYDEVGLLSPCAIDGFRVRRIADVAELTPDNITAINSGMTIDLSVFKEYTYNERYFLDYIDHAFMRDMKGCAVSFAVTRQTLRQRFAGNERGNKRAVRRRFAIFKTDFRRFCGKSFKGRLMAEAVIMRRRLKMML